ncbi:MAG: excinuclease ABC subunit UvrA [Akkermansiaceae bacterium]|nr:excinuclease ABC subunit UvrA [Akkermansiaceae bacterium]
MDIRIRGASQNSLKHIDLSLPAGKLIALMGPSGSGKSSLARDTLFAESRRRFLDCLSPGARRLLARPEKPRVESIEGLPPALCLEQGVPAGVSRSVLGSITEALDYLRILYAAIGCPHDPATGERLSRLSPGEIVSALAELPEGARITLLAPLPAEFGRGESAITPLQLRKAGYLRLRVDGVMCELDDCENEPPPQGAVCELVIDRIVAKPGVESRLADSVQSSLRLSPDEVRALVQLPGEAAAVRAFHTRYRNEATGFSLPDLTPELFSHYSPRGACPECQGRGMVEKGKQLVLCPACRGMRLQPVALAVTLSFGGREIGMGDFCRLPVSDNLELLEQLEVPPAYREALQPALDSLLTRLGCLRELGLDYLSLSRPAQTLSGGELQRARLAGQIGGGLSGVLYILDEPTIGLHPAETQRLITALQRLRDKGNTVLVVEHDPQLLRAADWLVEMGPGSGPEGGYVLAEGTYEDIVNNPDSPTGAWLSGRRVPAHPEGPDLRACRWVTLRHAGARNLQDITFRFPLGAYTCLSGPGGSGKSTLVHECLLPALKNKEAEGAESIERAVVLDQSPIGSSARSTPATATGLLDVLRPLYAALPLSRQRGYTAARFSLNTRGGRCERCAGTGLLQVDMNFLADLYTPCDACRGARYNRETLEVTWRGKSIAQALALTVDEALAFFEPIPAAAGILRALHDLGLGYLPLDRAAGTLSGGEAQRIRIASYLAKAAPKRGRLASEKKLLFVLDEPTTGLHYGEVELLLRAIYRLRAAGHSILCIEHHADMLACADYLVELGPGSGPRGGRVVRTVPELGD